MNTEEGNKCDAKIQQTFFYGKGDKVRCPKVAVITDANGRHLCRSHYNRWLKKVMKGDPFLFAKITNNPLQPKT